jgi:hypothetical protein
MNYFNGMMASGNDLSVELLANIFGYLDGPKDIMQKRRVCKKWKEAVKITIVPPAKFRVDSVEKYNAMAVMTRAMPSLQQITLHDLGRGHKWSDGEDPDDARFALAVRLANWTTHDIETISNFSKLRILEINAGLNGRYFVLFNSFPLLQKLSIKYCRYLKWELEMLAGLPSLKELKCSDNTRLTGSMNSLIVLKDTLEKVTIECCENVEGNFMDLAAFPHLKKFSLFRTAVTGDIRDIGDNDFSALEHLDLSHGVYGGRGYEFQRISDAPELVRAVYLLKKQRPALEFDWRGKLSEDSPDRYGSLQNFVRPPFNISLVQAGTRVGYRWSSPTGISSCEVNWLDPEPNPGSRDFDKYTEELQEIEDQVTMYRGFYEPPTEEEYNRFVEEHTQRRLAERLRALGLR